MLHVIIAPDMQCNHAASRNVTPPRQPRWLTGLKRSLVHSLMIARHCVLRNWDRILVRAVKGLISRAGWSRYVRYCGKETLNFNKPTKPQCDASHEHVWWMLITTKGAVNHKNMFSACHLTGSNNMYTYYVYMLLLPDDTTLVMSYPNNVQKAMWRRLWQPVLLHIRPWTLYSMEQSCNYPTDECNYITGILAICDTSEIEWG